MSKENNIGSSIFSNFLWSLFERWGAQGVTFIVSIILARLLEPKMYAIVALAHIMQGILNVFVDSGLGSSLVQKKNADELDFSTVFFFNVTACVVIYAIIWFLAPLFAEFYKIQILTKLTRISAISILVSGTKNILVARIQKHLQFKKFFFATLAGTIGAGFIGIWMAYHGFGVWALVSQALFNTTVDTMLLWYTVHWRPMFAFSLTRLKSLLSFGWKILLSSLINSFYLRVRELVIGKRYQISDLAYYNKASGWPNLLFVNISGAMDSIMFPVLSKHQDDMDLMKKIVSQAIRVNTFVLFPLMACLSVCAEPAVRLVLTEKWLPSVFYMKVFCFTYGINVITNTELNAVRATGRSDLFLFIEITKKVIDFCAILITMWVSVKAMALSLAFTNIISIVINILVLNKLIEFRIKDQILDFLPNFALALLMMIIIYPITILKIADPVTIVLQVTLGAVSYLTISKLLRMTSLDYILSMVRKI